MNESNPSIFRSQVENVETPAESIRVDNPVNSPAPMAHVEPTFMQYKSVTGRPFTSEYFQLGDSLNHLPASEQNKVNMIESYLDSKIRSRQYKDNTTSAKEIIGELETKLNLTENHDPYERIDKIVDLIGLIDPIEKKEIVKDIQPRKLVTLENKVKKLEQVIERKDVLHKRVLEKLRSGKSEPKIEYKQPNNTSLIEKLLARYQ